MKRSRILLLIVLASSFILLLASSLAFSPFVRSKADDHALRYGASLSIRSVRPALFGVRLYDVDLSFKDIPALTVHLDQVLATSSSNISATGGVITIRADRKSFVDQLTAWRASRPPPQSSSSPSNSRHVSIRDLRIQWPGFAGDGSEASASGVDFDDILNAELVRIASARIAIPIGEVQATALEISWSRAEGNLIRGFQAASIRSTLRFPAPVEPPPPPASSSAPPPAISGATNRSPGKANSKTNDSLKPANPLGIAVPPPRPEPDPNSPSNYLKLNSSTPLRDRLADSASLAALRMTSGARLKVDAFEVHVERGKDSLTIGPGTLAAERKDSNLLIDLAPGASAGEPGITFKAAVPLGAGPVVLDVNGGPIKLAALGVREGDLGLIHPDKASIVVNAHVELKEDSRSVTFRGNVKAIGVSLMHPKLAEGPVEGLSMAARLQGGALLDGTHLHLEDSEIDVGSLRFNISGLFERDAARAIRVDAKFGIPLVPCQEALDSLPATLVPVVHDMRLAGTLSLTGRLRFDPARPQDFLFDYRASNDCRFVSVPPQVDAQRFKQPFKRTVYKPDNQRVEIDSGPGTPGWVPIGGISQNMEMAVMTTEDGRFRIHHGFDHEAIHNSVKDNLIKGAFVRGASTISMQLAKNLYLERNKTVSRKLQELILTMYLEQVLTKEQILELYLNVVEFGPMLYGIGPAAAQYFRCAPSSLTPGQALYLSSILPSPKVTHFAGGGRLHEGWMKFIWKLIKIAEKRGWLTSEDSEAAQGEWVVMGGPPVKVANGLGGADGTEDPASIRPEN